MYVGTYGWRDTWVFLTQKNGESDYRVVDIGILVYLRIHGHCFVLKLGRPAVTYACTHVADSGDGSAASVSPCSHVGVLPAVHVLQEKRMWKT